MVIIVKNTDKVLFNQYSKEKISEAVKRVGAEITRDYAGKKPLIIGVLKGSFIFMADLVREIDLSCQIDFMVVKSYGGGTVSSGYVNIVKDVDMDIRDRDVIIVEDILDTAGTLQSVCDALSSRNPRSLKVCVFLNKRNKRKIQFDADYECFEIEDEFVVGYGLDYAEKYRNLPYLAVLNDIKNSDEK
ncbi:MAG: hypoxanthine phosphoribosyltransferase [Oscillospiraceae bacterium]|nr:hypoxanthine phosphoribosyltransferase [Oscillospiraceae bacterium]